MLSWMVSQLVVRGNFQISIDTDPIITSLSAGTLSTSQTDICPGLPLPNITGTHATSTADFSTSDRTYQWQSKVGNGSWSELLETGRNFINQAGTTISNQNISLRRIAWFCGTAILSNTITFTPKTSTVTPGSIRLWVDDDVNNQQSGTYSIPPNVDPGVLRSTQINGVDDDGTGDPAVTNTNGLEVNYIWQSSTNGGNTWQDLAPCGSNLYLCNSYDPAVLTGTVWYRRIAENDCGTQAISNVIKIEVVGADGYIAGKVTSGPGGTGSPVDGVTITIERDNSGVQGGKLVDSIYTTMTNELGEYEHQGLYYGPTSADFTVTPSKVDPGPGGATHVFNPTDRQVTLSASVNQKTAQDFQDASSFTLTGNVYQSFGGTDCPMDTVSILLQTNGSIVKTDAAGNYSLNIPSTGTHTITPMLKDHVFSPPSVDLFIDQNTTQDFENTEQHTLSGVYRDGCGNVVGQAKITIISTDLCIQTDVTTDAMGNYSITLPANRYNLTFEALAGGTYDPLVVDNYFDAVSVDLMETDQTINFIYRPPLTMRISGLPSVSCLGEIIVEQLQTYPITIEVFEGALDGCPLDSGVIVVTDNIGDKGSAPGGIPNTKWDSYL